jgi:uncharacterized protein (TIRG00374 family)
MSSMIPRLRSSLLRLLPLAAAIVLLWFVLRSVALADVLAHLRRLDAGDVLALALANALVLATFSARWWLLLHALGHPVAFARLVGYRLAAFSVSYFTPGPHLGGEPVQVYLVTARQGVPVSAALASVVLDKTLEMLVNFSFLAAGALFVLRSGASGGGDVQVMASALGLIALPAGLLLALGLGKHPATAALRAAGALIERLPGRRARPPDWIGVTRFYRTVHASEEQGSALIRRRPLSVLAAVGVSLVSWVGIIGEFWLMTALLGLDLTLAEALLALVAARAAILLPLPAAVGALEASQAIAMGRLGLPSAAGVSLSLLIRARDVTLALGGAALGAALAGKRRQVPVESGD